MSAVGIVIGDGKKEYPGNLTATSVTMTCIVAAMGGLIFGYDIGISGGVTTMESFQKKFYSSVYEKHKKDHELSQYCRFDSVSLTLFTSSLYLTALCSCVFASYVTRNFGRKLSMLLGGVLFCVRALLNSFAIAVWMLIVGHLLLGFGIGFTNQAVSLYLSEMAPYKYRGALNIGFQLLVTIDILVANILNFFFSKIHGEWGWRLRLGGAFVPALIITIGSLILPDTPNSMIKRGQSEQAEAKLRKIRGVDDVKDEINDLITASGASGSIFVTGCYTQDDDTEQ